MAITEEQIKMAQSYQHSAAHDKNHRVRLVAGPGTGKSYAIGERIRWLLSQGVSPESIFAVSFTNAASEKLRDMIDAYCKKSKQVGYKNISVSTLHSLGLKALRKAGQLHYPVDPLVLDDFEVRNILDLEFSKIHGITPSRSENIRKDFEAFSNTGQYEPVNYIPPDPPINQNERNNYLAFHYPRTLLYSCILPGEIVRQCVDLMYAGTLNPKLLLNIQHLIVDEYQDFNPADIEFINWIADNGAFVFVAGDDDQSIYSFRYATPEGIQKFLSKKDDGDHELPYCFRCTPNILGAGQELISKFSQPSRIQKNLSSLYMNSEPKNPGMTLLWKFPSAKSEAESIASCCSTLIEIGVKPRDIMILLSYTDLQIKDLQPEFEKLSIPFSLPKENEYIDTNSGRFILAILRLVCNPDDYVAYRLLLGLLPHIGPVTCNNIASKIMSSSLKYGEIFQSHRETSIFSGRELSAINRVNEILDNIAGWSSESTLEEVAIEIEQLISNTFGEEEKRLWQQNVIDFPKEMNLNEVRDYIWTSDIEVRANLLNDIYERIGLDIPSEGFIEDSVSFLTMHGAKGLDSKVVFIPGLEEQLFPGPKRCEYTGLILEAARMLYVSITRAKAVSILSFSTNRILHGKFSQTNPSRFINHVGKRTDYRGKIKGFKRSEIDEIKICIENL